MHSCAADLIPALTRLNNFAGAIDQYITLLSAFPEDASLNQEAALYALKHSRQPQLLDFLRTTVKQSPRDSRFMILLAAAETTFDDLPAAESAYSLAINIRKDRVDPYAARVNIEMRLSQSDPAQSELAAADFQRLYLLTYHDPSWMVRLAELRARQQRPADAVKALQAAYIDGHAKAADDFFTVAAQLERWNLLAEARTFAEQGVALAGSDLLTPPPVYTYPQPESGAVTYARILARCGQADQALATLTAARQLAEASATSPSVLAAELARENITVDEVAGFRQNFATQRRQAADQNLKAAIDALGKAIQAYYTPEQKQAFALTLDKLHDSAQFNSNPDLALQAATVAGIADREADWRKQSLLAHERNNAQVGLYVSLQQRRLQFSALAHDLKAYAARLLGADGNSALTQAALAFRDAGDTSNEIRLTRTLVLGRNSDLRGRYFDLLLRRDPTALPALAASSDISLADSAPLDYTVAHGSEAQALAAVASRGQSLNPVGARPRRRSSKLTSPAPHQAQSISPTLIKRSPPTPPSPRASPPLLTLRASSPVTPSSTTPAATESSSPPSTIPPKLCPALKTSSRRTRRLPRISRALPQPRPHLREAHNIDASVAEYNHALELPLPIPPSKTNSPPLSTAPTAAMTRSPTGIRRSPSSPACSSTPCTPSPRSPRSKPSPGISARFTLPRPAALSSKPSLAPTSQRTAITAPTNSSSPSISPRPP